MNLLPSLFRRDKQEQGGALPVVQVFSIWQNGEGRFIAYHQKLQKFILNTRREIELTQFKGNAYRFETIEDATQYCSKWIAQNTWAHSGNVYAEKETV